MKVFNKKQIYFLKSLVITAASLSSFQSIIQANDIVPDKTLNSKIVIDKQGNISGGVRSKNNQFYSFLRFSIGTGSQVYFVDPGVSNILVRVTGNQASIIDGTLGVSGGNANLFLLNPNGITFGQNASLSLNGSFMATTGDSVLFDDGSEFSVAKLNQPSLLTVNIPVGVRFGQFAKPIINQSISTANGFGLRVAPQQTLALLGGDVSLTSGYIFSPGSRIELGSVAENSLVTLTPHTFGWQLGYQNVSEFKDISISDFSAITTFGEPSGSNGGDIILHGRKILISDLSEISTTYSGNLTGGSILINASELIEMNNGAQVFAGTDRDSQGNSGNITFNSQSIRINNFSIVEADSLNAGLSGQIILNASKDLLIKNQSKIFSRPSDLRITAGTLIIKDSKLIANSLNMLQGGNIIINSDLVVAQGSEITAQSEAGPGGRVEMRAKGIFLSPDTVVSATSNLGILFDGIVDFEVTEPDPRRSLAKVPTTVIDPATLVSQNPCRRMATSEFSNLGRGGLPATVEQEQAPEALQTNLVSIPEGSTPQRSSVAAPQRQGSTSFSTRTAAQGWRFNEKGAVVLLAYRPDAIGLQRLKAEPSLCVTP